MILKYYCPKCHSVIGSGWTYKMPELMRGYYIEKIRRCKHCASKVLELDEAILDLDRRIMALEEIVKENKNGEN